MAARGMTWFAGRVALAALVLTFPAAISAQDQASAPAGHGFLQARAGGAAAVTTAETLPAGFQDTTVFTGLTQPTNVRFASDGRVFVAEKSGLSRCSTA